MPAWAIEAAFNRRGWTPETCSPVEIYTIATEFGVGYDTLLQHLRWSLQNLASSRAFELGKITPKTIREQIIGNIETKHLLMVDRQWVKGNIDLQVGHMALLPKGTIIEGDAVSIMRHLPAGQLVQGQKPGIARATLEGAEWDKYIRVSRADFVGLSIYRHLEEADVD